MLAEQSEMKQLDKGWKIILMIWGAIFGSLGVYLIVCVAFGNQFQSGAGPDFPMAILKNILLAVSILTLLIVRYLRKYLIRVGSPALRSSQTSSVQHPVVGKYASAILITSALLESIGLYGVVLFFLTKDNSSLYLFLIISAAGMIYFRPRKDELLSLVATMKVQQ
jgi:hypothetical protein